MLMISNPIPSFSASSRASLTLPSDEYGPGIATPVTLPAPIASAAITAVSAESIPPAEAQQGGLESAFANVVARAQHESFVDGLQFIVRLGMPIARSAPAISASAGVSIRIVENQVLGERPSLRPDRAIRSGDETRSVEDKLIVAACLVHHHHGEPVPAGDGGDHFRP